MFARQILFVAALTLVVGSAGCQRWRRAPTSSPHYEQKEFVARNGDRLDYYLMTPNNGLAGKTAPPTTTTSRSMSNANKESIFHISDTVHAANWSSFTKSVLGGGTMDRQ